MKLKIVSDGTVTGTKLVNAETGELVEGCYYAEWHCHAENNEIGAMIWLRNVAIEAMANNSAVGTEEQTELLPL